MTNYNKEDMAIFLKLGLLKGGQMIDDNEKKIQYILDEHGQMVEMYLEDAKPVEYPISYKLKNAYEVFVRVDNTENYWVSNYGRCVNNLKSKIKNSECNKFYEHKQGDVHYTIFEIERYPEKIRGRLTGKIEENRYRREYNADQLVASKFLVKYIGRNKLWHKDGNNANNWYKNLLYVSEKDYKDLKAAKVTWQELNLEQEYIEYVNKAVAHAYKSYNGILKRCGNTADDDTVRSCYDKSKMCQLWLDDPKEFVRWYLEHYYECVGEEMDVDKDLFGDGSGMYSPNFCCILPKGLNTLLANSKKHYEKGQTPDDVLPLGVRYNSKKAKYYAEITFTGGDKIIPLSEWNTPEEAFAEYKMMKQADILRVVAEYKQKIPEYIYKKFLTVEVKPY